MYANGIITDSPAMDAQELPLDDYNDGGYGSNDSGDSDYSGSPSTNIPIPGYNTSGGAFEHSPLASRSPAMISHPHPKDADSTAPLNYYGDDQSSAGDGSSHHGPPTPAMDAYKDWAAHPESHGADPKSSWWRRLLGGVVDTAGTWAGGFGVPRQITHHLAQDVRYGADAAHAQDDYYRNLPLKADAAKTELEQSQLDTRNRALDEQYQQRQLLQQRLQQIGQERADTQQEEARTHQEKALPGAQPLPSAAPPISTGIPLIGTGQSLTQTVGGMTPTQQVPKGWQTNRLMQTPTRPAANVMVPPPTNNWPTIDPDMANQLDKLGIKGFHANEQLEPRTFNALQATVRQQIKAPKPAANVTELEQIANDPKEPAERRAVAKASLDDELRRALASRPPGPDRVTDRADKSYTSNISELDKIEKTNGVYAMSQRLAKLRDSLNQHTPASDALVAPELLSIMAGGQGSGLRMNEAEISRIVGGRSHWQSLKAAAQQWSLDPKSANSITADQRQQIRALYAETNKRITKQQGILDKAYFGLTNSDDPKEHRKIVNDTRSALAGVNALGPAVGTIEDGYRFKGGDPKDKKNWELVTAPK